MRETLRLTQENIGRDLIQEERIDVDELKNLYALQAQFENTLKITHDPLELLHSSYNPVTDRWHVEQLRRKGDIKGLQKFRDELWKNQETNLMERLHAVESYGEYSIVGDQLCSKEFPDKPFGEIIKRGALYRAALDSPEQEREGEPGEGGGWKYINGVMTDLGTQVGTTILSFSPPGIVENTAYDGHYVDKYTLDINSHGKRHVKHSRIAVDWDYDEYKKQAVALKSDFFDGYDGRPIDAWFLSHPILTDANLQPGTKGMSPDKFASIFDHPTMQRLIKQYERNIFSESVEWLEIALSFNAILNCADELKQEKISDKFYHQTDTFSIHQVAAMDDHTFEAAVYVLGTKPVAVVGGGGCPPNRGINVSSVVSITGSGIDRQSGVLSNSVAKFGLSVSESCNKIACKKCSWEASETEVAKIQKGEINACPKCGWKP